MRALEPWAFGVGRLLLSLAFLSALIQARRRKDSHRVDLLLFVGLLLITGFLPVSETDSLRFVKQLFVWLLPAALLRLVRHFRHVSGRLLWLAPLIAIGASVVSSLLGQTGNVVRAGTHFWAGVSVVILTVVFVLEARRSTGVKARRITLASIGSALLAGGLFVSTAAAASDPAVAIRLSPVVSTFLGLAYICYFFGFSTPRPLLTRWRNVEQAKYLGHAMDREPEERGRQAGDDLFQAAVRGVGGAVTFVALRTSASSDLTVTSASAKGLVGKTFPSDVGLAGRAVAGRGPILGAPSECGLPLIENWLSQSVSVLVAPIVASGQVWGIVLVGLRRGTLFPEDDLAMLSQVSRNAATAMDHAQLLSERREHERLVADRRVRELESRVELMLDSIKDYAMLVLDAEGKVVVWQQGAQHVFGYTEDAIVGRDAAVLFGLPAGEFTNWLAEATAWGHTEREGFCTRADSSTFVGTTIIRPLVEESGELPGFVAVTHDVTDRRHLEDRLRQGQKMEAIGQLAGGVAHDFNNLLTAILGYADWLDSDLVGDRRRDRVVEIQKAAERAAELTRQLLAFSRRQMLQPSAINLSNLVSELLPLLRRLIGEQIEIVDETTPTVSAVLGDRSQVEQVVLNLAVNARDAMPAGGRLTIRTADIWLDEESTLISGLAPGPHVLLEVRDTGTGMDEATRQRVFEPFFTTKDVGQGTGLGLSTVYGIAQQMGGAVEVESTPGHGATFRLWFPQTSQPEAAGERTIAAAAAHGDETVLLVEDEAAVRKYLTHVLESHGYRVLAAEHPSAALALTESFGERIDLVISDVVMPGSTGPELVRLLGQARPGLSALFISGYADSVLARHASEVQGHQLLLKPFSSQELLSRIRQILAAA